MMIFERNPLEKFIISELKKNNFNVNAAVNSVFNKYPFFKKRDLTNVAAKLVEYIASKQSLNGFWTKINGEWELISKEKIKSIYLPEFDRGQTNIGRGNRYNINPSGRDPDRYEPPKETIQDVYERFYNKYRKEISELSSEEINKILLQELASLGYEKDEIKNLKLR
jgi:hypothetical protein